MSAKWRKKVLAAAGAVVLAGLTAAATGLGQKAVDAVTAGDSGPPISYSIEEQGAECGSTTYLPSAKIESALKLGPPTDWEAFQHQPGASFADDDVVQVAIQGESARTVTLTGIRFDVEREKREEGALFSAPCGGGINARGLVVDVEANPAKVTSSSEELEGSIESGGTPDSPISPITFPWTVSLTDPLLLYVVAKADFCDCTWSAEIPWVSGSQNGTIEIDDHGEPFRVVGDEAIDGYSIGEDGWRLFQTASGKFDY
ncbi:MAG TPA: hypothetical protein VF255_01900 [Solirubrobacterales bacterium]